MNSTTAASELFAVDQAKRCLQLASLMSQNVAADKRGGGDTDAKKRWTHPPPHSGSIPRRDD